MLWTSHEGRRGGWPPCCARHETLSTKIATGRILECRRLPALESGGKTSHSIERSQLALKALVFTDESPLLEKTSVYPDPALLTVRFENVT